MELLAAPNCPSGKMDVLLMPDQMMLQIHESIGHPIELDRILGDERNFAGTSFVTLDMFGTYRYGSDLLNVTHDPTRPESRLARAVVDDLLQRAAGRGDVLRAEDQLVTEPGTRYVDFLVPGLVGMNIMSAGMWGVGWVIVEDRQKKLLRRMVATPMRRSHYLLAFVLVRLMFLVLEVPVLVGFAVVAFGVPLRGSLVALGAMAVLGALAFSGLGLLVASRAKNTQTASGLMNLVMMPMFVLSGVFFSADHFPRLVQPVVRALPLTALNDGLRAVMNEGAGLAALAPEAALLAGVAVASFGAALRIFRWT
jgi:ABC-type multidrug transport system permease subunit